MFNEHISNTVKIQTKHYMIYQTVEIILVVIATVAQIYFIKKLRPFSRMESSKPPKHPKHAGGRGKKFASSLVSGKGQSLPGNYIRLAKRNSRKVDLA